MAILIFCEFLLACLVFFLIRDAILYRNNGLPALDIGFSIFLIALMFCVGYLAIFPGFSQQNERYSELSFQKNTIEGRLMEMQTEGNNTVSISDVIGLYEDVKSFNDSLDVVRDREDGFFTRYPGDTAIVNDIQPIDFTLLSEKTVTLH